MLLRSEGIVIRSIDYGENHKIITVYTKSYGKMGMLVHGAKKVRSRYAAATQLFTYGEFICFRGFGSISTLRGYEIKEMNHLLRNQLHLTAYAAYVAELVDRVLQEEEEAGGALFEQLLAYMRALALGKDAQVMTHVFEMKLWEQAGVAPQLYRCVSCNEHEHLSAFSCHLGGALCHHCQKCVHSSERITRPILQLLQRLMTVDIQRVGEIMLQPSTKQQLRACFRNYMDVHVGMTFKSRQFLELMEKFELSVLDE